MRRADLLTKRANRGAALEHAATRPSCPPLGSSGLEDRAQPGSTDPTLLAETSGARIDVGMQRS